jgi:hypothetical protein
MTVTESGDSPESRNVDFVWSSRRPDGRSFEESFPNRTAPGCNRLLVVLTMCLGRVNPLGVRPEVIFRFVRRRERGYRFDESLRWQVQRFRLPVVSFGASEMESGTHPPTERRCHPKDRPRVAALVGLQSSHDVVGCHRECTYCCGVVVGHDQRRERRDNERVGGFFSGGNPRTPMEWEEDSRDDGVVWSRSDRTAFVRLRHTAADEWAVTLDRLRQAPDGETFRHETFADRAAAERRAEEWRSA